MTQSLPITAVIPARYASTRFPGKPLVLLGGRPLVQHVWLRCVESRAFARIVIATDDERILETCRSFGAEVVATSPDCPTGTDRVAEVARAAPHEERWVNVQGDEPLIAPEALRVLAEALRAPGVEMATLIRPLGDDELQNPNVVKAVCALSGDALYFSRAAIPFQRDASSGAPRRFAHLGLYGYTRTTLLKLAQLTPTPLEESEKLEQLRALEHSIRIRCVETSYRSVGVDTPEDLLKAERLLESMGGAKVPLPR